MKIQDIGFVIICIILLILRKPRLNIIMGLSCFFLAIPLFSQWIFFTAERLTWYGAGFILMGIVFMWQAASSSNKKYE